MKTSADFRRRLAMILCAVAFPVAGSALNTGGEDDTGDGGDSGAQAGDTALTRCLDWDAEAQGECPTGDELKEQGLPLPRGDHPVSPHDPGIYADGQCCYTVEPVGRAVGCGCAHGRPLVLDAHPCTAAPAATRDWFDAALPSPSLAGLSRDDRARLAHHWASIAVQEHGSIASFHRVALELLRVGAPPSLVLAAHRAASDEVRHARYAFTLATWFAGAPIGPATLPLPAVLPLATSRLELAVRTVREACVEETLSLAAAHEMWRGASEPVVRRVLGTIIADETRHAAFAWEIVRWVVDTEGDSVRAALRQAFSDSPFLREDDPHPPHPRLAAWGCVSDAHLAQAVLRTRCEVVDPLADRMVA